jgi:hypothetical protein
MFQAQYLFSRDPVFSPWFDRKADNIIGTADLIARAGGTLKVALFHKNKDEPGSGTQLGTSVIHATSAKGRAYQEWEGVKELVRYRFLLENPSAAGDRVLFRMLNPVWFDAVTDAVEE